MPSARRYDPGVQIRTEEKAAEKAAARPAARRSDSMIEAFGKSFARQLGTKSGQALVRGVLGSLFRGK